MLPAISPDEETEPALEYAEIRCKESQRSICLTDGAGSELLFRLTLGHADQRGLRLFPPPRSIHRFAIPLGVFQPVGEIENEHSPAGLLYVRHPKISTFSVSIFMSGIFYS